jgi:hypothetical protein
MLLTHFLNDFEIVPVAPIITGITLDFTVGDRGSTVVKVLRYKSEGRWFDSRWCQWIFPLT